MIEQMAGELPDLTIVKLDVDKFDEAAEQLMVPFLSLNP